MGLTASLLIGQSALAASQAALQVTGNNLANAATPGYHRQRVDQTPLPGQYYGSKSFLGNGVGIQDIRRLLDPAVQSRLQDSISQEQFLSIGQSVLSGIESLTSGTDLNGQLNTFFNSFSELANNPANPTTRASVVEQGASLAASIKDLRTNLVSQRTQVDQQLGTYVDQANTLVQQIADLNGAIVKAEGGQGGNNGDGSLRDKRDSLLGQLAQLTDISVVDNGNGSVNVLVGSTPVVQGTATRPLSFQLKTVNNQLQASVQMGGKNPQTLNITGGTIGGLLAERTGSIQKTIDDLDSTAASLIYEVNVLHTSGRPGTRLTDTTGSLMVEVPDQTLAFNDPANVTMSKLPIGPTTGTFTVRLTDQNGNSSSSTIKIDLDGITNAGTPGTTDDTSLTTLVASLNAIPNLTAQITPAGQLKITTAAGYDVSFGNDTSGTLATLGINTYFTGTNAEDIDIRSDLRADPTRLVIGSDDGKNETAAAIAKLRSKGVSTLGGQTFQEAWSGVTGRNGVALQSANTRAESATTVRQSLEAQDAAVGGVSVDEESINLIQYQQQYQGAAHFISVVDQMTQVLLSLVQ